MRPNARALSLYKSHRASLVSYARRLLGDPVAAEDVVQDAWLLFDQQPEPERIREPLGYLKRIVRNLVFAEARRSGRRGSTARFDPAETLERLADDRPTAEVELIMRDEMALVMRVIQSLPERQQRAFALYHFEELKLREVASRLGISVSLAHLLVTEAMQLCDEKRKRATR